ncbi:hypothetical protein [Actinoplanes sp. NPDC049681]|uniref:hypothetical protein n=1 Tax=Actinoplanes sp. NPDC049681 TaxID=3363905 RepID=UPI0037B4DA69
MTAGIGVAAAVVQVVGLLRWPLVVPFLAGVVTGPATSPAGRPGAVESFTTRAHDPR